MNRETLITEFNNVQNVIYELQYYMIVLNYIIDNIEEDELLDLDIQGILINYHYDKGKLFNFKKKLSNIVKEYDIDLSEIDESYFQELPVNIIELIKTKK